jgi:hypothetical protein
MSLQNTHTNCEILIIKGAFDEWRRAMSLQDTQHWSTSGPTLVNIPTQENSFPTGLADY